MAQRQYFARIDDAGNDNGEWMIAGVDLFNDPTNDPAVTGVYTRDGYWVTTEKDIARIWARQYSFYPPHTLAVRLARAEYVAQQEFASRDHDQWVKGMRSLLGTA